MWLLFASAAAVCFGLRGILYQWSSQKPVDRNLLLLGVYLCGMIVAFAANLLVRQPWTSGACWGFVMGFFSFISNAAIYKGFAVGKASLVAVFTGLPPVVVVTGAYFLWGETLTSGQWAAFIIIIVGILVIRYSNDISLNNLQGLQWAVLAMITFGITDMASKQSTRVLGETLPTLFLMYMTGSLLFLISWLLSERSRRRKSDAVNGLVSHPVVSPVSPLSTPSADHRSSLHTIRLGLTIGLSNISGMLLIMPAFRHGVTGLVSAVVALNVLLILLYARIFLKEHFSRMELTGISMTLIGMIILRIFG